MWDAPFDESMLSLEQGVVIHCPEEYLADELFVILREYEVQWYGDESMAKTFWSKYKKYTCYRVHRNVFALWNYGRMLQCRKI